MTFQIEKEYKKPSSAPTNNIRPSSLKTGEDPTMDPTSYFHNMSPVSADNANNAVGPPTNTWPSRTLGVEPTPPDNKPTAGPKRVRHS